MASRRKITSPRQHRALLGFPGPSNVDCKHFAPSNDLFVTAIFRILGNDKDIKLIKKVNIHSV